MFISIRHGPFSLLQVRLSEAIEAVDGQLDPTSTSDLSQTGLAKLLWVLTRQKPCMSVARLRCENYGELKLDLVEGMVCF